MSEETFDKTQDFASMGLRSSVLKGVADSGFENPSDIQAALIPLVLAGKDVMGQAKTGTGKTAAFGSPVVPLVNSNTAISSGSIAHEASVAVGC